MSKGQTAYFGLPWIVSLILSWFFGWILGIIVRFQRGKILLGIINILLVWTGIFWLIDFISIIVHKDMKWLA